MPLLFVMDLTNTSLGQELDLHILISSKSSSHGVGDRNQQQFGFGLTGLGYSNLNQSELNQTLNWLSRTEPLICFWDNRDVAPLILSLLI